MAERSEDTVQEKPIENSKPLKKRKIERRFVIPSVLLVITACVFYIAVKTLETFKMNNATNLIIIVIFFAPFFIIFFGLVGSQLIHLFSWGARGRLLGIDFIMGTYLEGTKDEQWRYKRLVDFAKSVFKTFSYYFGLSLILFILIRNALFGTLLELKPEPGHLVILSILIAYIPRILQFIDPKLSNKVLLSIFTPLMAFTLPVFLMRPFKFELLGFEELFLLIIFSGFMLVFGDLVADLSRKIGIIKLDLNLNTIVVFLIPETIKEQRDHFDFERLVSIYSEALDRERGTEISIIERNLYRAYELGLETHDVKLRRAVVQSLAFSQDIKKFINRSILNPAIAGCGDNDAKVRYYCGRIFREIGSNRAIKPLIYVIIKGDTNLRKEATNELAEIGEKAVPFLLPLLKHPDIYVMDATVDVFVMMGDKVVDDLILALDDDHPDVRAGAAEALGRIGNTKAIKPLIGSLTDADPSVIWEASFSLVHIGDPEYIPLLIDMLGDEREEVQEAVAEAIADIMYHENIDVLLKALHHRNKSVRRWVAWVLGEIGEDKTVESLSELSKNDDDTHVREAAKKAIHEIEQAKGMKKRRLRRRWPNYLRRGISRELVNK